MNYIFNNVILFVAMKETILESFSFFFSGYATLSFSLLIPLIASHGEGPF